MTQTISRGSTVDAFLETLGIPAAVESELAGGDGEVEQRYRVLGQLGRGGMGVVLRTEDLNVRRFVAMKVLHRRQTAGADDVVRFVEEAQITGQLEHPNVVPVHELGVGPGGNVFYTMKEVKGKTLKDVLRGIRKGDPEMCERYRLPQLLGVFQQICDAVAFGHAHSVIHRDLKPANIMLGEYGEVLVLDWGLAKILGQGEDDGPDLPVVAEQLESIRGDEDSPMTMTGMLLGTPGYMSPEQARSTCGDVGKHSDVYALGGILYCILTLHKPIEAGQLGVTLWRTVQGEILLPESWERKEKLVHLPNGAVPSSLSAVAMKALSTEKENRYRSVQELQADIEAYQSGFATTAESPSLIRQLVLLIRRNSRVLSLVAASVVVVGVVVAGSFVQVHNRTKAALESEIEARKHRQEAERSRQQAEEAVEALRSKAPTFHEQAISKAHAGDLVSALEIVDKAISLQENEASFHQTRGDILLLQHEYKQAVAAYERAVLLDKKAEVAARRVKLCKAILKKRNEGKENIRQESRFICQELANSKQFELLLHLLPKIAPTLQEREEVYHNILVKAGWKFSFRTIGDELTIFREGGDPLFDLDILRYMDFRRLFVVSHQLRDISAIQGKKLIRVDLPKTRITSLEALRGMPLEHLGFEDALVSDLEPLRGMKLKSLDMTRAPVSDLTPLEGMPLEELRFSPRNVRKGMEVLRGLKSIKTIYMDDKKMSSQQFWATYDAGNIYMYNGQ